MTDQLLISIVNGAGFVLGYAVGCFIVAMFIRRFLC